MLRILYFLFYRIVETDETCPICSEHVDPKSVATELDIRPYLQLHSNRDNVIEA